MEFFNTLAGLGAGFVVGEEHTTTASVIAKTSNGEEKQGKHANHF